MTALRPALGALLCLLAAACGTAAAAPAAPTAPAPGPAPAPAAESVRIVQRLADASGSSVEDVIGLSAPDAQLALEGQGLNVQVFAFDEKAGEVSAQWPAAGEPVPADAAAVIWIGSPPEPPPAPAAPVAAAAPPPVAQPEPASAPSPEAAPEPQATNLEPAAPAPGGRTPGLENMTPPPHPPRANIRTLPAAKAGTTLTGRASWYGPGFAGQQTACGGIFNPAEYTLASRELRCGTQVVVTGTGGRTVEATVTDWGPAEWTNRRFDLSQATMAAVGGLGAGVIDVSVEVR